MNNAKIPTVGDYLTKKEVNNIFDDQGYQFCGDEDQLVIVPTEQDTLPCDRTKAMIAYLNALADGDDAYQDVAVATIIQGYPQRVQLRWGEFEGEVTWKLITESEGGFNESEFVFWAFVLEVNV